jgi:putative tryptophan/tyrosine transport system substrate-binding protein
MHEDTSMRSWNSRSDNRKPKIETPKWLGLSMAFVLVAGAVVQAQQPKVPRIGFLATVSPSQLSARVDAFRRGLRELGYLDGKNLVIEYRWADGKFDQMPNLAADLVRLKVDIIVTGVPQATRPAKEATSTIPIVMGFDQDPLGSGFVASLARPGGNITGLSSFAPEMSGSSSNCLRRPFLDLPV